jgi:hypothetical protein
MNGTLKNEEKNDLLKVCMRLRGLMCVGYAYLSITMTA